MTVKKGKQESEKASQSQQYNTVEQKSTVVYTWPVKNASMSPSFSIWWIFIAVSTVDFI